MYFVGKMLTGLRYLRGSKIMDYFVIQLDERGIPERCGYCRNVREKAGNLFDFVNAFHRMVILNICLPQNSNSSH